MPKKAKPRAKPRANLPNPDDCVFPPPIAATDLQRLVMPRDEDAVQKIAEYVEWQAKGETVEHAEKVSTEFVMGRKHECWDVRTDKTRWWVITSPTNLYSQDLMPSLDYTLSFHVGVMARVASANKPDVNELEQLVMADAWRRWEQAGEMLNEAEEAEDFQSVGMRCRECLIVMVRTISLPEMVPEGSAPPKHADVVHRCEMIANHIARGSSAKEVRGYLKSISKSGWELVNWLTHAQNATRADGILAHEITQHILATFGTAAFRHRQGIPDRCGSCGSYRIALWAGEPGIPMKPRCVACGWMKDE